jgi:peptide/nickel transport system ATP-binding protein
MTKAHAGKEQGKGRLNDLPDPMTALNPVMDRGGTNRREHQNTMKGSPTYRRCEKAADMLELVGIPAERGRDYPHQFSVAE